MAQLVRLARKERLSYDEFAYVCQQARKKLKLEKPKRERRLPQLLTGEELNRFFKAVRDGGQVQHEIMLKGVALELEQKFPLRDLSEEGFGAVRVAQGPELPAGDLIREREIIPAEHVHMLMQQRGQPRHILVVHHRP